MQELRQSTQVTVVIGPFVDVTDGKTPETGVTLSGADEAEIVKHGASGVTSIAAATWAAITDMDGYYNLTLTTSLTDTLGMLTVAVNDDDVCLPVMARFMICKQQWWDSKYSTDNLQVDAVEISSDTTAANNLELACDGTGYNVGSGQIVAASVTGAVGSVTGAVGSVTGAVGSVTAVSAGAITSSSFGAGAINAAAIATNAIDADALAADAVAEINATVDTALADIGLDHLLSTSVTGTDVVDQSVIARMVSKNATADWDTFNQTTDSLEALRDNQSGATAAAIADAVWDEARSGHVTGGTFGEGLASVQGNVTGNVVGTIGGLTAAAVGDLFDVDSGTTYSAAVAGSAVKEIADNAGGSSLTLNDIADAIWDEARAGHTTGGTFGEGVASVQGNLTGTIGGLTAAALADFFDTDSGTTYGSAIAGSVVAEIADNAGGSSLTLADIADAIWDEARSGHVTGGTFGEGVTSVLAVGSGAITAASFGNDAITAASVAANAIGASELATDAVTEIVNGIFADKRSGVLLSGTAQSGTSTTIVLAAATSVNDDLLNNMTIYIHAGSGANQARTIVGWASATDTATVDPAWDTNPASDSQYVVFPSPKPVTTDANLATVKVVAVDQAAIADFFEVDSGTTYAAAHANSVVKQIADNSAGASLTNASIADAVWDEANSGHVAAGSTGAALADILTDTGTTLDGLLSTLDSNVQQILVDTGTTLDGKLDTIDGIVDAILLDTGTTLQGSLNGIETAVITDAAGANIAVDIIAAKAVVDAILVDTGTTLETHLTDMKGATFDDATDSLEALRDRGDAAWITGAGGAPPQLLNSTTIATLASQTSFTLTAGSSDDNAYNGALCVVIDSVTSTQIAMGVVSDYTGSSKTVTLAADPGIFTMAVGDTVKMLANTSLSDATSAKQDQIIAAVITNAAGTDIAADIIALQATATSILTDTGTTLQGELDNIESIVNALPTAAEVNAEVSDVLKTDTITLPGQGAPTATPTFQAALAYLYKAWRNKKEQTATSHRLFDDAGTTVDQKATVSDDGTTATKGEIGSGP